jgi:hypothetical protein
MSIRKNKDRAVREVWIGLVGVYARPGVDLLGDAHSAWVNILASAASGSEYRAAIKEALDHYGLDLRAIEDSEPLSVRLRRTAVDVELLRLADEVKSTGLARFGTFHTFAGEDPGPGSLTH